MRKIWVIARREYHAMVRTKAFLITILIMPILMGGAIVLQKALEGRIDVTDKSIVVLDGTGSLFEKLAANIERLDEYEIYDRQTNRQVKPRIRLQRGPSAPATDEVRFELSERVRKNELYGFAEIAPDALSETPPAAGYAAVVHMENLIINEVRGRFQRALADTIYAWRYENAGIDRQVVERLQQPVQVEGLGLYVRSDDGAVRKADRTGSELARLAPLALLLLMFMTIMISTQPMLQSVLEEKQQRIAEVLLGSARPFDLMMGKLLGNVGVALTILAIYFAGIWFMASRYGYTELLPTHLLGWFLVYEVLAVMLFGSIMVAIGAACTELKEAQSYMFPVSLVLFLPLMVWFEVLRSPMSGFSTWLSFFPPATPMLMLLRMTATTAVPLWQPVLGVVVVLAATVLGVLAAGRIFRIGLLSLGKAPQLGELMRWILRG